MRVTVNDASLGESGSKLSKVAATSLLMGVTRGSSDAYILNKMEVTIAFGGLKLKVSYEPKRKPVFVRGHDKMINGKLVSVKPHFRKK